MYIAVYVCIYMHVRSHMYSPILLLHITESLLSYMLDM